MSRGTILMCIVLLCATGAASADERSAALVEAFQSTCLSDLPSFVRLEAAAAAENLPVKIDVGAPRREGFFNHIKTWTVAAPTGAYDLTAAEARGPAGLVQSCTVSAPDPAGEETKQDLMKALNLGPPEREAISPDGVRRSAWRIELHSESMILLLIDRVRVNARGVELNVTHRLVPGS